MEPHTDARLLLLSITAVKFIHICVHQSLLPFCCRVVCCCRKYHILFIHLPCRPASTGGFQLMAIVKQAALSLGGFHHCSSELGGPASSAAQGFLCDQGHRFCGHADCPQKRVAWVEEQEGLSTARAWSQRTPGLGGFSPAPSASCGLAGLWVRLRSDGPRSSRRVLSGSSFSRRL